MIAYPVIDPVLFHWGPLSLRWYGLAYIAGIVLGWRLLIRLMQKSNRPAPAAFWDDLLFYTVTGILVGGRLGYVLFYNGGYFWHHPWAVFRIWEGGMSFHGGFLGVLLSSFWVCRRHKMDYVGFCDHLGAVAPIGLFLGRLANFVNGELWGRPTKVPWAMVFPRADGLGRHPSQLYEAFCEGLLLFGLLQGLYWFSKAAATRGLLAACFLTGYGIFRFVLEFFRQPDSQLGLFFGVLSMGQILSLPMFLGGGVWMGYTGWKILQSKTAGRRG